MGIIALQLHWRVNMPNTLRNETPYNISYMGVNNLKRDALILAGLIALEAVPFVGWITAAAEGAYEVKLALKLAKAIKQIIKILKYTGGTAIVIDQIADYLMIGAWFKNRGF